MEAEKAYNSLFIPQIQILFLVVIGCQTMFSVTVSMQIPLVYYSKKLILALSYEKLGVPRRANYIKNYTKNLGVKFWLGPRKSS